MSFRRTLVRFGAAVLLGSAGCAEFSRREAPPAAAVRNALHYSNGIPLIAVHAPGEHTAWFAIDTGAGKFTFIDPEFSKQIGLKCDVVRDPAIPFVYLSAPVSFLELDGFGRRDLTVYIHEVSERSAFAGLDVKVQGALGTGFFRGQCLRFDWETGEFTPNEPRQRLARHVPIPLRYGPTGELYCTVKVDGKTCAALIDTASPQSLVTKEFADDVKLEIDRAAPVVQIETSLGPAAARDGRIACLGLGTEEVKDLAIAVVDRRMPHANLLLGTDVLSRYGVLLDLSDAPYLVLDPASGAWRPGTQRPAPPESPPTVEGGEEPAKDH